MKGRRFQFLIWTAAGALSVGLLAVSSFRTPSSPEGSTAAWVPSVQGAYLAARYAQINADVTSAAAFYPIALEGDPNNPMLLQRTFMFAALDGNIDAAADYAKRLGGTEPLATLPQVIIVTQAIKQGRLDIAETRLSSLSRQGINSFVTPILLAWVRFGQNDTEGAFSALEMMETNGSFKALAPLHRAMMEEALGDKQAAARSYDRYLALAEEPMLRGLQLAAGFFAHNGQEDRARRLMEDYSNRFPDSLLLENALVDVNGPRAVAPVGTMKEGVAELFYGTASFLARDDYQSAALYNRMALYLRPDFPLSQFLMGQLMVEQGRFEEAQTLFQRVARAVPSLGLPAGLEEVKGLRGQLKMDEAIYLLEKLVRQNPDKIYPRLELADLLRTENRFEDAVKAYSGVIDRIGPPDQRHWAIFFGRGVSYERIGQWLEAEADFTMALKLEPEQPLVMNYLGYSWVDQGIKLTEAKALIERAVEKRPKDGAIIDSLGWAHYRLGDYDQAVKVLEWAVRERPDDPTINDHLGDAYWMVGRRREATFQWDRALALSEDEAFNTVLREKLKNGLTGPEPIKPQGRTAE